MAIPFVISRVCSSLAAMGTGGLMSNPAGAGSSSHPLSARSDRAPESADEPDRDCARLVEAARDGDREAFTELIVLHERAALSVAYGVLGDGWAAGDVTQEALLRAWQRLGELESPNRFGPWLIRMTRNLAIDARRRIESGRCRNGQALLDDAIVDTGCGSEPGARAIKREGRRAIEQALSALDETTRCAVVMRYYDNLSSRQIGEMLNLSAAAVDMRLSRARALLRERLGEEFHAI
jgi:RNA polymerase sigma-70 factor, ECF subfamily